jgi:hypothetical protein
MSIGEGGALRRSCGSHSDAIILAIECTVTVIVLYNFANDDSVRQKDIS